MNKDQEQFQKYKELIERIRREETLQPGERDNEGFDRTKGIFLNYGLSAGIEIYTKHKLWREKGMHEYMQSVLLEMFKHNNPTKEHSHVNKTIESGAHIPGTKYPDITWEDLECHAAVKKVDEIRKEAEKRLAEADQSQGIGTNQEQVIYEYLTLEELVSLRCSRDTGSNKVTTRDTLLRHCNNIRNEYIRGKIETPCGLYTNKSDLHDIEITEIPDKGTGYKFRRLKDKT